MSHNNFYEEVLAVLKENGYKNTTFDKIAKQTNVGRSTLFKRYKNKEELIYSVIYEQTVSAKDLQFLEQLTYNDLAADLRILIGEYVRLYMKQMPVYRLFMLPALNDKELNQRIYEKLRTLFEHFSDYLVTMNKKGKVADFPFASLANMLFSTILEKALLLTGSQLEYDDPQVVNTIDLLTRQMSELVKK